MNALYPSGCSVALTPGFGIVGVGFVLEDRGQLLDPLPHPARLRLQSLHDPGQIAERLAGRCGKGLIEYEHAQADRHLGGTVGEGDRRRGLCQPEPGKPKEPRPDPSLPELPAPLVRNVRALVRLDQREDAGGPQQGRSAAGHSGSEGDEAGRRCNGQSEGGAEEGVAERTEPLRLLEVVGTVEEGELVVPGFDIPFESPDNVGMSEPGAQHSSASGDRETQGSQKDRECHADSGQRTECRSDRHRQENNGAQEPEQDQ